MASLVRYRRRGRSVSGSRRTLTPSSSFVYEEFRLSTHSVRLSVCLSRLVSSKRRHDAAVPSSPYRSVCRGDTV
ncbi:hypothetical protein FJT64_000571 [Amphibalanus amphitrite]|uniref:Uncharacterized protein n=1 Tax=Amphibalanus amphitrite TaxID=1232801 RepID=A0A6A4VZZ5_AMPAM|nr:hypothetical protein FJT64_000571 [Amphibalanus amphitrite]